MELNDKNLELVVSEKSLGKLTTNAIQIKELVLQMLPKYDIANYDASNVDQAKKDKALLNNSAKALNSKRIELEKEFLRPFEEFKGVISETVKLIGEATQKIDSVVKESEKKAKEEKHTELEAYWMAADFGLVPLAKIWDDKWLNKSTSLKSAKAEMVAKISQIQDDLGTLRMISDEDADLLQSLYLDTLNINSTIEYSNTLRENRKKIETLVPKEAAKAYADGKITAEEADAFAEDLLWDDSEHFEVPAAKVIEQILDAYVDEVAFGLQQAAPEKLERIMRVVGTKEQLIALADWMFDNEIHFEKLENATA